MGNKEKTDSTQTIEMFNVDLHQNWLFGGNTERVPGKVKPVMNNVRLSWSR